MASKKPPALAVAIPLGSGEGDGNRARGLEKLTKQAPRAASAIVEEPRSPSRKKAAGNHAAAASRVYTPPDEEGARNFLRSCHWSHGLQSSLLASCNKYPIRFYIIDDSGSMNTLDGHRIVGDDVRKQRMIKCTRWSELCSSLRFHAELSHAAKAPTEFRFLNLAEPVLVGSPSDEKGEGLEIFLKILDEEGPGGQTPLCEQIKQVVASIQRIEDDLRRAGQKACVIVATDGEPTDGDLVEAMRPLQQLPVWLVVRICSDDEAIVTFWNNIDEDLEIDMDVLDDIQSEAEEIRAVNSFLYYNQPLHQLREFGSAMKELDLIDEAMLSSEQMSAVCSMLLCDSKDDPKLPLPELDFGQFISQLKAMLAKRPVIFDPILRTPAPLINVPALCAKYDQRPSAACTLA